MAKKTRKGDLEMKKTRTYTPAARTWRVSPDLDAQWVREVNTGKCYIEFRDGNGKVLGHMGVKMMAALADEGQLVKDELI